MTDEGQNGTFPYAYRESRLASGNGRGSSFPLPLANVNGRNARNILEVGHLARGLKQVPMWALVRSSLR